MAEDTRGWLQQPNPSKTYTNDDGDEVFGAREWAYRRPGDHLWVYSGVSADQDPPSQSVADHIEESGHEAPVPDSVAAASEVAEREAQEGGAQGNVQGNVEAQANS